MGLCHRNDGGSRSGVVCARRGEEEKMTYEMLREKAHRMVDSMSEARLENFVVRYDGNVCAKKPLSAENISEMLSLAGSCDFCESPASIQRFRELTKNDVW